MREMTSSEEGEISRRWEKDRLNVLSALVWTKRWFFIERRKTVRCRPPVRSA